MADDRKPAAGGVGWKTVLLIVLGIYALVIVILNSSRVKVDFVFFHARTRVFILVLLSMALGALIMWLVPRLRRRGQPQVPPAQPPATQPPAQPKQETAPPGG